jgi:hypothetical protein
MVFASLEGKLPFYEHGPFDHEDLLWEVVIQHIGMQQGPHFVEVAFIPTTP